MKEKRIPDWRVAEIFAEFWRREREVEACRKVNEEYLRQFPPDEFIWPTRQ